MSVKVAALGDQLTIGFDLLARATVQRLNAES
jgi:hypothetical protein